MVVVEEIVVIVVVEEMIGKRIDVWFSVRAIFILLRTSLRSRYRGGGVKEPSEGEMFFAGSWGSQGVPSRGVKDRGHEKWCQCGCAGIQFLECLQRLLLIINYMGYGIKLYKSYKCNSS